MAKSLPYESVNGAHEDLKHIFYEVASAYFKKVEIQLIKYDHNA
jgi:hypothetical protein